MNKKQYNQPHLAEKILGSIAKHGDRASILGDIGEEFSEIVNRKGLFFAKNWYRAHVLCSLPGYLFFNLKWSIIMLANYLKLSFRSLKKQKDYSIINIAGLSIGMACCILILLWVRDELSYDRFHSDAEQIHRINLIDNFSSRTVYAGIVSPPVGPFLEKNYPEVINSARIRGTGVLMLKTGNKIFNERGSFVDPSFFEVFSFPFIEGNNESSFTEPLSIVLTEDLCKKVFGDEYPIGKSLTVNNQYEFKVTGIIKNIPENSLFLGQEFFVPLENLRTIGENLENWGNISFSSFVKIAKKTDLNELNKKIRGLYGEQTPRLNKLSIYLQPLVDIHLKSGNLVAGLGGNGNIGYIYIFSVIAVFILLIACVNFMNLTTAKSDKKSREVGMRKVVGAGKSNLILQFFGESLFLTFLGLIIAVILVILLLPLFNDVTAKNITLKDVNIEYIFGMILVAAVTGFISGSYPAVFLSSFKPVKVLRSSAGTTSGGGSKYLRRILVVFQFSISVILLICTFVVIKQMNFIMSRDIGFDKEQIIFLRLQGVKSEDFKPFKDELLRNPDIMSAGYASDLPINIVRVTVGFDWEGKPADVQGRMNVIYVDYDFIETMNIKMTAGRPFSEEFLSDSSNFIMNESALKVTGLMSPLGKKMSLSSREGQIVGIVKNFHFRSLHSEIGPLVMMQSPSRFNVICLRIKSGIRDYSGIIDHLKTMWNKFVTGYEFNYGFLDDQFESMYLSDRRLGKIVNYFTVLAIFVSCLGLLGLAAFMAERRTKEIGIRKVLGASNPNIVKLLSREFIVLLIISNVIAWPAAYYFMSRWLQGFAFKTQMNILIFLISGVIATLIAFFTVGFQALRAANANPVDSLKIE